MVVYALGTDETDVCAFDDTSGTSWVVCSTNIQADRPYADRVADALTIVRVLNTEARIEKLVSDFKAGKRFRSVTE